ncbi:actinia tenebrosa protease inhibitors [Ixodes scapularis]
MALKFLALLALLGAAVSSEDDKKSTARCYDQHPPFERGCEKSATLWFYNETVKNCEPRTTPLCGDIMWDKNVFKNGKFCKKLCRDPVLGDCAAPEPENVCRGNIRMYRFNPDKMRCEWFSYGGCGSKDGLFETLEACHAKCQKFERDPCVSPIDEGHSCPSGTAMPMYGFNAASQKCEEFEYKGCGGNGNNFVEKHECWSTCAKHVKDPCNFPINGGRACGNENSQTVFGYNGATKRCEQFGHRGCGGYPNKFPTAEECWKSCTSLDRLENPTRKCLRPAVKQTKGTHVRYFYNMTSNTCERSRYWLKDNSKNRFATLEECESTCKPVYGSSRR